MTMIYKTEVNITNNIKQNKKGLCRHIYSDFDNEHS